jgi:hypothetical protein
VVDDTGAGVDYHYIQHVLRQVELRVQREILIFVAWANNFDHDLRDDRKGVILVRRGTAEDRYIWSLEGAVFEKYQHVRKMVTGAVAINIGSRLYGSAYPIY